MKNNYFKHVCLLAFIAMFILSGCSAEKTLSDANQATEETILNEEQDTEEYVDYKYREKVFDSKLTEGKLAVYYFQGMERFSYYARSTNSGESILVVAPDGTTMLIDTNITPNTAYVVYALQQLGIKKIDYFVNTHTDTDHVSGFSMLARYFEIGQVCTGPYRELYENGGQYCYDMCRAVEEYDIPWIYLAEGDTFTLGKDVEVKVYNPPQAENVDYNKSEVNANEWSITLKLTYGDSSYFFGGDIGNDLVLYGRDTINYLLNTYGDELKADIVKMNHHGGDNSQSMPQEFIDHMNAKLYVGCFHTVSYDAAYMRCKLSGAEVLHTSLDGTVVVYTDGDGTYNIQVEQERYSDMYGRPKVEEGYMKIK